MRSRLPVRLRRTALTLVMLLVIQVAFAAQVCHAITGTGMHDTQPRRMAVAHMNMASVEGAARSCCDDGTMPARACISSTGKMLGTEVTARFPELVLHSSLGEIRPRLAVADALSASLLPAVPPTVPPLAVHIRLLRFLS